MYVYFYKQPCFIAAYLIINKHVLVHTGKINPWNCNKSNIYLKHVCTQKYGDDVGTVLVYDHYGREIQLTS
jgi:hypothetical protein